MAALGTIFNKLGASGIGKIFTTASEEAKKVAYRLTDGGKNAIGILGKMEVVAKGLGAALKVALSPLALITMAIGFMQKLSRKGKEGATHMRSMSQDTMDLGRNLGVSSEKAKELAGQATAIGSSFGMTTSAAKQAAGGKHSVNLVLALLFGLIHGLGFSNYFKMMIGRGEDKILPLLEFSLGIEAAQIIIVVGILLIGAFLQNILKVNKRDWILVCSSIVIGFAIQMMLNRIFW